MKKDGFEREFLVVMGAGVGAGILMILVMGSIAAGLLYLVKSLFF